MEKDNIQEKLDEVIASDIEKMSDYEVGTKERNDTINELTKLYGLRTDDKRLQIDAQKMEDDVSIKLSERDDKIEQSEKQAEIDARERKFNKCMMVANLMVPIVTYGLWYYTGLRVDAEGRYIPQPVRDLCKHFRPIKK